MLSAMAGELTGSRPLRQIRASVPVAPPLASPHADRRTRPHDLGLLVLVLAGAGFGLVVLYGDYAWWDQHHRDFAQDSGAFGLWVGLMCA